MPITAPAGGPDASTPAARALRLKWLAACALAAVAVGAAAWAQLHGRALPEVAGFKVVAVYPHDPNAFTQGLAIAGGQLYEGTGLYGQSTIRKVDLATGRVEKQRSINATYFGEGIAILGSHLYELTWQHGIGIVYDLATFNQQRTFQYAGEGWGLTQDGKLLILSDGSSKIRFLDPETFAVAREIDVRDHGQPVTKLNELEYVDGEIWSNVWYDDRIARISPASGEVLGWIDLAALYPKSARGSEAVLNGIAYDAAAKRLFVTGKNWPQLYEIQIVRK
jgi:glutaminyl-peptide cyclotransferase